MMAKLVTALGVLFVLVGLWVAVFPEQLVSMADWESRGGLNLAASMRVVTGLVLIAAASVTRYPRGLRVFGILVLVAGLLLFLVPLDLWASLMRFWSVEQLPAYRFGGGLVGVLLGAFLIHASFPRPPAA
jgi:hypothetical protein